MHRVCNFGRGSAVDTLPRRHLIAAPCTYTDLRHPIQGARDNRAVAIPVFLQSSVSIAGIHLAHLNTLTQPSA